MSKKTHKQANKQTCKARNQISMQVRKLKVITTPTPKPMVHVHDHVKWYFQCSHWCIGWPMLVKAWSASNPVVWTNKCKRFNNENRETPSLQACTKQKWLKVHDMYFVDLPCCCATLLADVECKHSLDCDMQENVRKVDHLRCASVLVV